MTPDRPTATRRYKEITAGLTAAVDELRRSDRAKAAELAEELVELDDRMARVADREAVTRYVVMLHWEAAIESLWNEHWMTLSPLPKPSAAAAADSAAALEVAAVEVAAGESDFDDLDVLVEQRAKALADAQRRRSVGIPRLPGR